MLMKHLGQDFLAILCSMGTVAVIVSVIRDESRPAHPPKSAPRTKAKQTSAKSVSDQAQQET